MKSLSNPEAVEGMARYGINPNNNLGISVTTLRNLARAYYSLGKYKATIECFEKSLEFDWESTAAHMARLECMRLRDLLEKKKEKKEKMN